MATHVLTARIMRGFRFKAPIYDKVRGHTGVDLDYRYENLPSPITGTVVKVVYQKQMGWCLYIRDVNDNVHVFAHLSQIYVKEGQIVKRDTFVAKTGNTGTITTAPHLHYEIVCPKPYRSSDRIMVRSLPGARGYNTDPLVYDRDLYGHYRVPIPTGK